MASYNIARYYNMEHIHGAIATGRIANINILESKENPVPTSVIAKGQWVKRDGVNTHEALHIDWSKCKSNSIIIRVVDRKRGYAF